MASTVGLAKVVVPNDIQSDYSSLLECEKSKPLLLTDRNCASEMHLRLKASPAGLRSPYSHGKQLPSKIA